MVNNKNNGPVNKSLEGAIKKIFRRKEKINKGKIPMECVPVNKTIKRKTSDIVKPGVSIIVSTNRKDALNNILSNYIRQNYEKKELIIVINNNDIELEKWNKKTENIKGVKVFELDEKFSLGRCLNFGISKSKYEYIAKFDDDDYYGPKYIVDSLKKFKTINELTLMSGHMEEKYTNFVSGSTMIFKKEIFNKVRFSDVSIAEDVEFCRTCLRNRIKIYSGNKYHYLYIREHSEKDHTWQMKNEDIRKKYCKYVGNFPDIKKATDYVLSN
ncbi:glycosyltransferase [Anaerosalibacter bizertensis]|uniref:glycosyltransferase n=1 Tax=Anaerosalibacter bizertensis TaxID=932217 RepID=UPI0035131D01